MDSDVTLAILMLSAIFYFIPKLGCAYGAAFSYYLYSESSSENAMLLIAAGIFAIGVAITGLRDLELKLTDDEVDKE